jgi:guanylate kinase
MTFPEGDIPPEPVKNHNFLVMIAGPTASGKDSIMTALGEKYSDLRKIVSYTTRFMRPRDINGVDYHFISDDQFHAREEEFVFVADRKIENRTFYYGMAKEDLLAVTKGGAFACHLDLSSFGKIPEEVTKAAGGDMVLAQACLDRIHPIYLGVPRLTVLKDRYFARHRFDDEKAAFLGRLRHEWSIWHNCRDHIPHTIINGLTLDFTANEVMNLMNDFVQ